MIQIGIKVLHDKFVELASEGFENSLKYSAVLAGASVLQRSIRDALISKMPKATVRNPKYNDTLADAIMFSKPNKTFGSRVVHALGSSRSGSGTYRTRFFDKTTKDRYQKTYKGKKLKKKRYLGKVGGTFFFSTGLAAGREEAQSAMIAALEKKIQETFDNG